MSHLSWKPATADCFKRAIDCSLISSVTWLVTSILWLPVQVLAAEPAPVAYWGFGQEEATPLQSRGRVHRDLPGPRPSDYPDFAPDNTAVRLDGNGARFTFADTGPQSVFDFTNGDEITLEAWASIADLQAGENSYIIGKGRTGDPRFPADNQNWALRVREMDGQACLSFLFATVLDGKTSWHRWTTDRGFQPGKSWHHLAVAYHFGEPDSIRAVIDGHVVPGKWDLGGATTLAPVVDDDAVWIGSSMGGARSSSLRGFLDEISIYRKALDSKQLQAHYRGPAQNLAPMLQAEVMPELGDLPAGIVQFTLHEEMPSHARWLNTSESVPPVTMHWSSDSFLFSQLPQRYDDWGGRTNWKGPVLMRVAADVALAPGKQTLLLRVRGLSRLWVDGELVARSRPITSAPNGEEPITPVASPPLPGHRSAEHRQQEIICDINAHSSGRSRIVLETLIGGKSFHTDPGESCVAVLSGDGTAYQLLQAAGSTASSVPLTDRAIVEALDQEQQFLQSFGDANRRQAAASQNSYWQQRHERARDWVQKHPAPEVPGENMHPVDAFVQQKIDQAFIQSKQAPTASGSQFHSGVLPLLRSECFRCHDKKANGGLRLNSLEAVLQGGDSGLPVITAGNPDNSEMIRRILSDDTTERMPPGETGLTAEQKTLLVNWVKSGADWPAPRVPIEELTPAPIVDDAAFLRRVSLDTIGVLLDADEIQHFLNSTAADKRLRMIDRLLADDRWADQWMGYWQDILAENPTLINKSLNTTGPFRWFLYDALRDNQPLDRLVTELVLLRGHPFTGGSAGFGLAGDNDAPLAAKGQILASAFLGVDLQCARCHDSPYHSTKQADLFALAAMLQGKPITVPKSSRVPLAFFENQTRASLIHVSLKPDEPVPPVWAFAETTDCQDNAELDSLLHDPKNTRERLAGLITSPANTRFAEVFVNRVWRRYLGAGLVEPPDDWEGQIASHPDLLAWLSRDFIAHNYDIKHLARTILTSQLYQRQAIGKNRQASSQLRFFTGPDRRRMSAEQIVDTLHVSAGQRMNVEELTFDPDGRASTGGRISLGVPNRSWMFANLANERDRPSLNLPRARAITDILEAFGWTGARQSPRTDRELAPSVLQPGILSNGPVAQWLTRATVGSGLAECAAAADSPEMLIDQLFLRYLCRFPTPNERAALADQLAIGFADRLQPDDQRSALSVPSRLPQVTWSNHLTSEANSIIIQLEERVHQGPPADPRFKTEWLERYQDVTWSLINLPEFVWVP